MIGYVILGTSDLPKAASFYDDLLGVIGLKRQMDFGERGYGWGLNMDAVMLCVMTPFNGNPATVGNGTMTAIGVDSRKEVDLIHAKALELGAQDEGAPGLRAEGGDGFYAAYFRDLDGHMQILLSVREEFTRIYLHQEREEILRQSLVVFSDLAEITRDYYASGRAHQQDVVQAQLELARVEERLVRIKQQEEQARARLAEWIGDHAFRELDPQWPDIDQPEQAPQIVAELSTHPRLRAWQHEISKSKTSEEIARQAYKPGFAVDLAYGGRGGQNPDGSRRSDFVSVFVTMDIPLFTKNRQDRILASSIAETSATQFARDDIFRAMKAQVEEHSATLIHERERLGLYEELLLPQAAFNAEAAFEAYQDAVDDLTTLMRARIGEYELKLSHAALRADEIITRARLLYLQGEIS